MASSASGSKGVAVFITGASRGFGAQVVASLHSHYSAQNCQCLFVLAGRDTQAMEKVAKDVGCAYKVAGIDLSDRPQLEANLNNMLGLVEPDNHDQFVLVNNAGSLGDLSKRVEGHNKIDEIEAYFTLNLTSTILLTSLFLERFKGRNKLVVNISSLLAIQPAAGFSLYCTGKAARDMLHACIAAEADDTTRVLNYAPGPLDTGMQDQIRSTLYHADTRQRFEAMHEQGSLVSPRASANKMTRLIAENTFKNGAHIDYFDE